MIFATSSVRKGFTLIELLVVIAIISILSSVVLANLGSARQKSRDGKRVADMKQVQLTLELYYDTNSEYPSASTWATLGTALVGGGFISQIPSDPSSGKTYGYRATPIGCDNGGTRCTGYYVGAIMEGVGQTGSLTSDIDTDIGGNNLTVDATALNCNENAGAANERLYCSTSL
jgi:prepilin-type N-terminal cleavage/methylation domain-containing protein